VTDYRANLEGARARFRAPELLYESVLRRRERRERNQRITAGIVGVAVVAATILAFSRVMLVDPAARIGGMEPSPRVTSPEGRPISEADLRSIVFGSSCRSCDGDDPSVDDAPSGTKASTSATGLQALRFAQPPQSRFMWPVEGFEGARVTAFLDPTWGDLYVVSWAAVFVDAATASEVLHGYVADVEETWGWSDLRRLDPRLGAEGVSLTGEPSALSVFDAGSGSRVNNPRTAFYLWRIDNLLLQVLAVGDYRAGEIRSMAETMTARTWMVIQAHAAVVPRD
jgi:hypothetical protein